MAQLTVFRLHDRRIEHNHVIAPRPGIFARTEYERTRPPLHSRTRHNFNYLGGTPVSKEIVMHNALLR